MTKAIHQLLHTLSYGDAISTEVFALQRLFRNQGYSSEIYAINTHPKLKGRALDYRELSEGFDGQVVLHYSLGSPLNDLYRRLNNATRSMIYHNLTPAHWFWGVNPRVAKDIEAGLEELPQLCRISDRLVADSRFNAQELEKLGFNSVVLNLAIDPERWNLEANQGIASIIRSEPGIHVLHVGRLAPNKCVEDIIKIFYFLHHKINKHSRLWLVGIDTDTEIYSFSLKRLVRELDLYEAVNFVGCFADSEVKALYENASVYMCMSEHEGFCLPVVEAMNFGLPVISYSGSALEDTVGSGGVLLREKRHFETAQLISEVCTNSELRQKLICAGKARVSELSFSNFEAQAREVFELDPKAAVPVRQAM